MNGKKTKRVDFVRYLAFLVAALTVGCTWPFGGDSPNPNAYSITKRDSIAVRAILDTNGMRATSVQSVVTSPHGKIEYINLLNIGLTKFVITSAIDTIGYAFGLDLADNQIDSIVVTDTVRTGFSLMLSYNKFTGIGNEFSALVGPMRINLDHNIITFISDVTINNGYSNFIVSHNMICSTSTPVANWLNKYDYTWASSQTCP